MNLKSLLVSVFVVAFVPLTPKSANVRGAERRETQIIDRERQVNADSPSECGAGSEEIHGSKSNVGPEPQGSRAQILDSTSPAAQADAATHATHATQTPNRSTEDTATEPFPLWADDCVASDPTAVLIGLLLLLMMGIYVVAVLVERWLTFCAAARASSGFEGQLLPAVRARHWCAALDACRLAAKSPVAEVAEAGILEMRSAARVSALSLECCRLGLKRAEITVRSRLRTPVTTLLTFSAVAPMVGLMTTIIQVYRECTVIILAGSRLPFALWSISGALVPLGFGIGVGLLAHIGYRALIGRWLALENTIATFECSLLTAFVTGRVPGSVGRGSGFGVQNGMRRSWVTEPFLRARPKRV